MNFGAFVEYLPSEEGLVHISKLAWEHVDQVEDVVSEGDIVKVKVLEIDSQGRINLSIRDVEEAPEGFQESNQGGGQRRGIDRNDRGDRGGRRDGQGRGPGRSGGRDSRDRDRGPRGDRDRQGGPGERRTDGPRQDSGEARARQAGGRRSNDNRN